MFYGRKDYLTRLSGLLKKPVSSFVTCRGRRRIGKSSLITEFARQNDLRLISIDGLPPRRGMSNKTQLANFARQLEGCCSLTRNSVPKDWMEAFERLDAVIADDRWTAVLLDEISWMGRYDPDFPGYLKSAWDKRFKRHDKLVFIVCGSVSSWISENILNSTGFVGRNSLDLVVGELTPRECLQFWRRSADRVSLHEVVDVLSVTGGVPKYLEEMRPELTSDENIREMCFCPGGVLYDDFRQIFNDVFGASAKVKREVLRVLATGSKNLAEIALALDTEANGHLSKDMDDLEQAGFVAVDSGINPSSGLVVRERRYRICDNYTRFYLHYIEPRRRAIGGGFAPFVSLSMLKGWDALLGFQFETFVLNNLRTLLPLIGFRDALVLSAAPYRHNRDSRGGGCQIDLLVQSKKSACVVEIKRRARIGDEVVTEVQQKVRRLAVKDGMSVRTALVYDGELSPGVREDGYFDFLVPVEALFE